MLEKLKHIERRYEEIQHRLNQPETYDDVAVSTKLQKEQNQLEPLIETYRDYLAAEQTIEDAELLMSDPEFRELAKEEFEQAKEDKARLEHELKLLLLPKDPNDEKNVIVEIRAGVGGEESALFAAKLYRMYSMYGDGRRWKTEIMNINETELGGIKEISFMIEGEGAYSRLKFESGVHRVQRVPETESGGRVHTSTATVAVLPEVDPVDFYIDPKDLKIDTFRSSGAGGQKVNKTSSAIRVTHLPTGTVVECQDERSQYKNKDRAISILTSRLYDEECRKQAQGCAMNVFARIISHRVV